MMYYLKNGYLTGERRKIAQRTAAQDTVLILGIGVIFGVISALKLAQFIVPAAIVAAITLIALFAYRWAHKQTIMQLKAEERTVSRESRDVAFKDLHDLADSLQKKDAAHAGHR
jgi:hypothetical protein